MARRTEKEYEALIQKHMTTLKCSRAEAIDLIECDDAIDKGDKELFALTKEQKQLVRKITKAERKPSEKRERKTERKVDEDKKFIFDNVKVLFEGMALNGTVESLSFKNESEISFSYNGAEYSVKFTKHRAKKD